MGPRKLVLISLVLIAAAALASIVLADGSDAAVRDDVRVFVEKEGHVSDPDNYETGYYMTTVSGVNSIREAVDKALVQLNMGPIVLDSRDNIASVDGRSAEDGQYWVVHQWLPLGTPGWGDVYFTQTYDEKFVTGCSLCLHLSTVELVNNRASYTVPEFKPVSDGFVFIRFVTEYNNPSQYVQEVFTEEVRAAGFWLKGRGSNLGEVLVNAIESNGFEIDVYCGTDGGGNNLQYWVNSMFGLETVSFSDGSYAYWSQYTYADYCWSYNGWTMGYYDPAVFQYLGCFFLISGVTETGAEIDIGEPPDMENIVPLKRYNDVEFRLTDGTVVDRQSVEYGDCADLGAVRHVDPPAGFVFAGWEYDNSPIVADTVIYAHFDRSGDGYVTVTYVSEGTELYRESVPYGTAAVYSAVPQKASDARYIYTFAGWDIDLTSVTEDVRTNATFERSLRQYKVTFYNFDNTLLGENYAYYDSAVECPAVPPRESSVMFDYRFIGWSSSYSGFTDIDTDHILGATVAYAYFEKTDRVYRLTFVDAEGIIGHLDIRYGGMIDNSAAMTLLPGYTLTFYHDAAMTEQIEPGYIVYGDKTVYTRKIAGTYTENGSEALLELSQSAAASLPSEGGNVTVSDISQMSNIRSVRMSGASVGALLGTHSVSDSFTFRTYKGSVTLTYAGLLALTEKGYTGTSPAHAADSGYRDFTVTVSTGRLTSSINKLLSGCQNVRAYNVAFVCDGRTVSDISAYGGADIVFSDRNDSVLYVDGGSRTVPVASSATVGGLSAHVNMLGLYCTYSVGAPAPEESSVNPIGDIVFETCTGGIRITSIRADTYGAPYFIPENHCGKTVREISSTALAGISGATLVVVPKTVVSFAWGQTDPVVSDVYFLGNIPAFSGSVPSSVTVSGSSDASGWGGYAQFEMRTYLGDGFSFSYYVADGSIVVCSHISGTRVTVPESIAAGGDTYPVRYIGDGAFEGSSVRIVVLGKYVQYIMSNAFYSSGLGKITFDRSSGELAFIGERAFAGTQLVNTDMPDSLRYIGFEAFRNCSKITRFVIPDSVLIVGDGAFSNCTELQKAILSAGISSVPSRCFEFCSKLDSVEIPENVTFIGDSAFDKCTSLSTINLRNVISAGACSFSNCEHLDYVVLGRGLTNLGAMAFANCRLADGVDAYCEKPEGFEAAFGDMSGKNLYVRSSVAESWNGFNYRLLDEGDHENSETDPLPLVLAGIGAALAVMAATSLLIRRRMFSS